MAGLEKAGIFGNSASLSGVEVYLVILYWVQGCGWQESKERCRHARRQRGENAETWTGMVAEQRKDRGKVQSRTERGDGRFTGGRGRGNEFWV